MCAIFGSVNFNLDKKSLDACLMSMNHRGPDNRGIYNHKNDNYNLIFGHNRLEILDIKKGVQPMISEDQEYIVVYNGEIYNFQELRKRLESLGHNFLTDNSDTEVLIHGYKEWEEKLPNYLNGMWSFAIFDKKKNKLFLSRDRFGEKPLFYYFKNNVFLFASELAAFTTLEELKLKINLTNLKKYCAHGFFPMQLTPFEDVFKLEGSHNLSLDLITMNLKKNKYWNYSLEPNFKLNEKEWSEKIYFLLDKSVKQRLVADVPIGVFLSGGLDSSIISLLSQKNSTDKISTFSINFSEPSFDESPYANLISKKINSKHYSELISSDNIESICNDFFSKTDEPLSDSSLLSYYTLCKFSRRKVKVALGGDAADELLGGYDTFKALRYATIFKNLKLFKMKPFVEFLVSKLPTNYSYMNFKFKLERFLRFSGNSEGLANPQWLSPLNSKEISEIFDQETSDEELYSEAIDLWKKNNYSTNLEKSLEFFTKLFLQDQILVKTDRLSMMNSLEVRSPFLDYDLIDAIRKIPNKFKLKGNISKYILKKSFERTLGKDFVNRKKIGFSAPISKFFVEKNKSLSLNSNFLKKKSNIFEKKLFEHCSYKKENRIYLWNILSLDNFLSKNGL
tara:strand:- start:174 stop:2036 length:1863 start_codon:yes stop_codon:yes gene_type:complete